MLCMSISCVRMLLVICGFAISKYIAKKKNRIGSKPTKQKKCSFLFDANQYIM